jgi:hypothetical protein
MAARWYGPADADFTPAAPPTLTEGPAYAVHQNRLFLIGGYDAAWAYQSVVQSYDWSTNTWTTHTALPIPVASYVRGVSVGDWIYFECWDDLNWYFRRYNPDTGVTEALAVSLANEHGLAVIDGVIYQGIASPTPYSYDIATDTWTAITGSPVVSPLTYGGVVEHDGSIIAAGGGAASLSVWRYTPSINKWDQLPDLPDGADNNVLAVARGVIVFIGGYSDGSWTTATTAAWVLDETLTAWASALPRSVPVGGGGGGTVGERIVTAGGTNSTTAALETGTHLLGHAMNSVDAVFEIEDAEAGPKADATLELQFEISGGPGAFAELELLIPIPDATIANLLIEFPIPEVTAAGDTLPVPGLGDPESPAILAPGTPTERTLHSMGGSDRYQFGHAVNGAVQGSVTRLHDGVAATPPTDIPFLEGYTESAEWARDNEVSIAREYYSTTAEQLDEPLPELMPADDIEAILRGRNKAPTDAEGNPIRWPLDADLCDGDWPEPCDEEAKAETEAAIDALLPTRMALALRAAKAAGVKLIVDGMTTIPGDDDKVEHAYRTEDKGALAVIGDMLLRGGAPYVITPGAMIIFGSGLPVGSGFAGPDVHTPAGSLWADGNTDQGGVIVSRNAPIVDSAAPVLQDFLDDLCGDAEDANDNFETAYSGRLVWQERSGYSSGPFEIDDPDYRETTTYIVKSGGRITAEDRYVKGYQRMPPGEGRFGTDYRFTTIERYHARFYYSPCCPEALVRTEERTYVVKQFDAAPGSEDVGGEGVASEDAVGFFEAMPQEYLESSRVITQRWHAEGWLRIRSESGTKFDGFEFSSETTTGLGDYRNESVTRYSVALTYSPSSRSERNVPIGGGVWMQHITTSETMDVPKREVVSIPDPGGPTGSRFVTEITGSQKATATNSYTVMTDQAPPTVSCKGDCPEATCEEQAAKEYAEALEKWQEQVDINAARRLNAPEGVLVQRFSWNGHHLLQVGDVVTTSRGEGRIMSVSWSGESARTGQPGRTTSAEVHSALPGGG